MTTLGRPARAFAVCRRLDASNQVIWFADGDSFDQTPMAFEVIDEWMRNIEQKPWKSIAENKPADAVDSCFDASGNLLHA